MVSHDAKECSVWLSSKGSLPLDQQEYGPWLRADPFSVGKKSFVFVPGTGGDFGGKDDHVGTSSGPERRTQGTAPPYEAATNLVDLESSEVNQNTETPSNTATISQTSHAGKTLHCSESLPIVMPANTHTKLVNFETQIQDIDMEINKYDSHVPYIANPAITDELSPCMPNYSDQVQARDKLSPLVHKDAHDSTNVPRDLGGTQSGLRTWKRLARLKQIEEQTMHVPALGKRPIAVEEADEVDQSRKKLQIASGEPNLMAEVAKQPRQSQ
nr:hypothetical protein CFP56_44135 [Quercus suber]